MKIAGETLRSLAGLTNLVLHAEGLFGFDRRNGPSFFRIGGSMTGNVVYEMTLSNVMECGREVAIAQTHTRHHSHSLCHGRFRGEASLAIDGS